MSLCLRQYWVPAAAGVIAVESTKVSDGAIVAISPDAQAELPPWELTGAAEIRFWVSSHTLLSNSDAFPNDHWQVADGN